MAICIVNQENSKKNVIDFIAKFQSHFNAIKNTLQTHQRQCNQDFPSILGPFYNSQMDKLPI